MIYLDHNATTPLLPEVRAAMEPWWGVPANPASVHRAGQKAFAAVEEAREEVAQLLGRPPAGVVFVSGATEGNHLGIAGAWRKADGRGRVAVGAIEHPCVDGAVHALGAEVVVWPAGPDGRVRPGDLEGVAVVALQAVNHETGVQQPIEEVANAAARVGAWLHVDAAQAAGKVSLTGMPGDGVVLSAHKMGGPTGVGALVLRDGEPFPPLWRGGTQERGRRPGTVDVAGVVGFGAACRAAMRDLEQRRARWDGLAERLRGGLLALGARRVGEGGLAQTTCVVFPGVRGDSVVLGADIEGLCVSSGAACASGSQQPSAVLMAMGDPEPAGAVRISFGATTTADEVDRALAVLQRVVARLRASETAEGH